jgi:exosortase/archaeosortase family protein
LWATGGVFGAFLVNVLRVSLIAVVIYYLGYERWGEVHSWIGYALFLAWLAFFFAVFSKRAAIRSRMSRFWRKLSRGRI